MKSIGLHSLLLSCLFTSVCLNASERYLIQGNPGSSAFDSTCAEQGSVLLKVTELPHLGITILELDTAPSDIEAWKQSLLTDPAVEIVEQDIIYQIQGVPNDPDFPKQWSLQELYNEEPAPTDTGYAPIITLIDTGIDTAHQDLQNNLWSNPGEQANGIDDDGNGWVDDLHGISVIAETSLFDENGHGTHLAGIIGAVTNNNLGGASVSPSSKILAIKAFDAQGIGKLSDILTGLDYLLGLLDRDITLSALNLSWGSAEKSDILEVALTRFMKQGILVIAAAGDQGVDITEQPFYPASYEGVTSVSAEDESGNLLESSNYGADIGAPGEQIYSTLPSNQYGYMSGTSMAAAHMTGLLGNELIAEQSAQQFQTFTLGSGPAPGSEPLTASGTYGDFNYEDDGTSITITGYTGSGGEVIIPSEIDGKPVVRIGEESFQNSEFTSIQFPSTLKSIGANAFSGNYEIHDIVLPDGITTLDANAFRFCGVQSINIPSSLTSIGDNAFQMSGLRSITLPATVTDLGEGVFSNCNGMESVIIEPGRETIPARTFSCCFSLTEVTIPAGVKYIGDNAFEQISILESVSFPDGLLTIGDLAFSGCTALDTIILPSSVTSIGNSTFYYCQQLKIIELHGDLMSIGASAFESCTSLASIIVPNSVTTIGDRAFALCSLLQWTIFEGDAPEMGEDVFFFDDDHEFRICYQSTAGGYDANWVTWYDHYPVLPCYNYSGEYWYRFDWPGSSIVIMKYIGSDEAVIIPSEIDGKTVTTIDNAAFAYCRNITSFAGSTELETIGDYAFLGCESLQLILFISEVDVIDSYAFSGCSKLNTISLPASITEIDDGLFNSCTELVSLSIPLNVTRIGKYSFAGCKKLSDINFPSGLTTIDESAFQNCTALVSVTFPAALERIYMGAFYSCTGLTEVVFESDSKLELLGSYAFTGCSSLETITLSKYLFHLGSYAFWLCTSLESVYFELDAPDYVGQWVFDMTPDTMIIYYRPGATGFDAAVWDSYNKMTYGEPLEEFLYTTDANGDIIITEYRGSDQAVIVPTEIDHKPVVAIGNNAFYESGITSIEIPSTVIAIGDSAFYGCDGLESVILPDGLESIGNYAFTNCSYLTEINIPVGVKHLSSTFSGCTALNSIILPDGISTMSSVFYGCSALTSVNLPSTVTRVDAWSFLGCSSLQEITVHEDNEYYSSIDGVLFNKDKTTLIRYPTGREGSYTIPEGTVLLGESSFSYITDITEVTFATSVERIGDSYVFSGCSNLIAVFLNEGLTYIGGSAFDYCSSLETIEIPSTVDTIEELAFNCSSMTSMVFRGNAPSVSEFSTFFNLGEGFTFYCYEGATGFTTPTWMGYPMSVVDFSISGFPSHASYVRSVYYLDIETDGPWLFSEFPDWVILESTSGHGDARVRVIFKENRYQDERTARIVVGGTVITLDQVAAPVLMYTSVEGGKGVYLCALDAEGEIVIPDTVDGIPVVKICSFSFYNCKNVTSITIPDSVTEIEHVAFDSCHALSSIKLPNNITRIDNFAFHRCASLTSIDIPEGVTEIGEYAFQNSGLEEVIIPDSVTTIEIEAFYNCDNLEAVVLGKNILNIENSAFYSCDILENVVFTGDAPVIGSNVFPSHGVPGFKIYYYEGAEGFTSPTWYGYPTQVIYNEKPSPVTTLVAEYLDADTVRLTWEDVEGETAYSIYKNDGSGWKFLGNVGADTTTTDIAVNGAPSCQFALLSFNEMGGKFGNTISVTYYAPGSEPDAVDTLSGSYLNASKVKLNWDDVDSEDGYRIETNSGSGWTLAGTVSADVTTAELTMSVTNCQFRVNAYNGAGETVGTAITLTYTAPVAKPAPVTTLQGAYIDENTVRLTWEDVEGETAYSIYKNDGSGWKFLGNVGANVTTTDVVLSGATSCKFVIGSFNEVGGRFGNIVEVVYEAPGG